MSEKTREERIAALEAEVAELKRFPLPAVTVTGTRLESIKTIGEAFGLSRDTITDLGDEPLRTTSG